MAETIVNDALRVKQWDDTAHKAYVRSNRFKRYMGSGQNSIINVMEDLTKKKGDTIVCPLLGALPATGYNDGSSDLVGNEKALPNDGHEVKVGVVRDATLVNVEEEQVSPISIRNAGKTALKDLQMRYLRTDIINAFGSVGGVNYASATATQKNAWTAANQSRVLFGSSVSNYSGTHSTALATIDGTDDRLTKEVVSLAKRRAQKATVANSDGIRPFKFGEDRETYVMFVGTNAFRDLRIDLTTVHKDAMEEGKGNPLFAGPEDLLWDGVVIRHIPELPVYSGVGNAAGDVEPYYLCGSQALVAAWAMRTKTTTRKEDDYGFKYGVGFMELRGVNKVQWNQGQDGVDWGLLTGFVASVADA